MFFEQTNDLFYGQLIDKACSRFGTKKENLILVRGKREITWFYDGTKYTIKQHKALLLDGASTPITIGDIRGFGGNVRRAFYIHDLIYGIFHNVPRRKADGIFTCFLEADSSNRFSRMVMYLALRMFGNKARKMKPKDHWNYGRAVLYINDIKQ